MATLAVFLSPQLFAQWSDPADAYLDIMDSNLYPDPPGGLVVIIEREMGDHEEIGVRWTDVHSAEIVLQRPGGNGLIDQISSVWDEKASWFWADGLEDHLYLNRWRFSDTECAGPLEHANSLVRELYEDVDAFSSAPMIAVPSFKPDPTEPGVVMIHGPSFQLIFKIGRFNIEARPGFYSTLGFHIRELRNQLLECSELVEPEVFPLGR